MDECTNLFCIYVFTLLLFIIVIIDKNKMYEYNISSLFIYKKNLIISKCLYMNP
jgi:hypothetical protein